MEEYRAGLYKARITPEVAFTLNQDRILKKYQLVMTFKIRIPTRQDWQTPDKIIDPNVDLWFTDRLGIHYCFDTGILDPFITVEGKHTYG
jgi:hypothetical protein